MCTFKFESATCWSFLEALANCFLTIYCMVLFAKASCVSQILTAQAVADDMGTARAVETGVQSWASCHPSNSERDCQIVMKRQKTKLNIPIESILCNGVQVPWISPESWLQFLVRKGLWPVLAGCELHDYDGARANWSEFWRKYEKVNPCFELFQEENVDYANTAAWFVHGDEGRTLKRGALMVTSLQSALGKGYHHNWESTLLDKLWLRDMLWLQSPKHHTKATRSSFTLLWIIRQNPWEICLWTDSGIQCEVPFEWCFLGSRAMPHTFQRLHICIGLTTRLRSGARKGARPKAFVPIAWLGRGALLTRTFQQIIHVGNLRLQLSFHGWGRHRLFGTVCTIVVIRHLFSNLIFGMLFTWASDVHGWPVWFNSFCHSSHVQIWTRNGITLRTSICFGAGETKSRHMWAKSHHTWCLTMRQAALWGTGTKGPSQQTSSSGWLSCWVKFAPMHKIFFWNAELLHIAWMKCSVYYIDRWRFWTKMSALLLLSKALRFYGAMQRWRWCNSIRGNNTCFPFTRNYTSSITSSLKSNRTGTASILHWILWCWVARWTRT